MPPQRRLVGACVIGAGALAATISVSIRWSQMHQVGLAVAASLPAIVQLGTAGIGLWVMYLFWPRRDGWGLHCRACGYHQERQGRLAPACPECGAAWLWIGNTKQGRPTGARALVALGALLCALAIGAAVVHRAAPWVYLRILPDRAILEQIGVLPDDSTADLWAELKRRRLPQATIDALARPLMAKKARDGYLSLSAESVVFDTLMRPGAPADLSAKYFASFLKAVVTVPPGVEEGRKIAVQSAAMLRGRTVTTGTPPRVMVLSALYRDGALVKTWEWELSPDAALMQTRAMTVALDAGDPGTTRLRQVFWLAMGTPGVGRVVWYGGEPVLPSGMSIKDQFEESRDVIVTPASKASSPQPR